MYARHLIVTGISVGRSPKRMNAWDWYLEAWRNYANFLGRSQRAPYRYFFLVHLIVFCLFLVVDVFLC